MLYKKFHNKNSLILVWKIEESIEEIKSLIFDFLSNQDKIRISNLKHERRQKEWLLSRYLLKTATNCEDNIIVKYDNYGKPFMDNFFINISHSKEYVSIIVSKTQNVSIDIQEITKKTKTIVHKFISDIEQKCFDTNNVEITSLLWSIKETAYKFYGKKELAFIDDIKITKFDIKNDKKTNVLIKNEIKINIAFHFIENHWLTYSEKLN